MLLAVGVTALIVLQAVLNVFAVLGLAPVTGVPLPFVSYGASNLLVMLASMGLLLNVAGRRRREVCERCAARRCKTRDDPRMSASSRGSRSQRAGPRGTWCPRWRSPTRWRSGGLRSLHRRRPRGARTRARRRLPLEQLSVSALHRRNPLRAAQRRCGGPPLAIGARPPAAAREHASTVVLGGGGYVAGPVALGAWTRRIPFVLTEADSHLGLTNRALAPLASRVCLAFPIAGAAVPAIASPVARWRPSTPTATALARAFGIEAWEQCVLVFGGSLGSRTINEAALDGLDGASFRVLHVTGVRDWPTLAARRRTDRCYDLREYLDRRSFGQALAACDLVVARAGGSIFEIAAYGRPAILVPYPDASADHQRTNAAWMERAGAAVVLDDRECTGPRLASRGRPADRRSGAAGGDGSRGARAGPPRCRGRRGDRAGAEWGARGGASVSDWSGRGGCTSSASAAPA
jgi:UDP-N-acetylglucosamine--N-acetylmuramyl-(pentapeptide) pyrophosphoryl-undecaprenol N-acetylglucosamine transferase